MNPAELAIERAVSCVECGLPFRRCVCQRDFVDGDALRVTHSGVVVIAGYSLRCYVLNNGQRIFDGADFEAFFQVKQEGAQP